VAKENNGNEGIIEAFVDKLLIISFDLFFSSALSALLALNLLFVLMNSISAFLTTFQTLKVL